MSRILMTGLLTGFVLASPVVTTSAIAAEIAGLPALPTTSVEDIIETREKWGTEPSK